MTDLGGGYYRAASTVVTAGRQLIEVSQIDYGVTYFRAEVLDTTDPLGSIPDLDDVKDYLGEDISFTDAEITEALAAETSAQWAECNVPAIYPADLRQALLRRVARNLTLNENPMSTPRGDAEIPSSIRAGRDPLVLRLEGPHRKVWIV
jgi:hypothetical protein